MVNDSRNSGKESIMVMPAGALALSPEFEKAKADLRNARERKLPRNP